jgi:hypothetical protein
MLFTMLISTGLSAADTPQPTASDLYTDIVLSPEKLKAADGYDSTINVLEGIFGDFTQCITHTDSDAGCNEELNFLLKTFDFLKWIPLFFIPLIGISAGFNYVYSMSGNGVASPNAGHGAWHVVRTSVGAALAMPVPGMPFNLIMLLCISGFFWSMTAVNFIYQKQLDAFSDGNIEYDPITIQSLKYGSDLAQLLMCADTMRELDNVTPNMWDRMMGNASEKTEAELAKYVLIDLSGGRSTQKIYGKLHEVEFNNPLNGNNYLERIDFGRDGQ